MTVPVNMCHLVNYVEENATFIKHRAGADVGETLAYISCIFGRSEGLCPRAAS